MLTKKEYEILELRSKQKLTQTEIANKLKISQAAVSKFERSAHKKIREAQKILNITQKLKIKLEDEL
ncbi:helix-turn-helix domain-containing protein [Candidatus Woesearchaeota archaeon]|nr:helix-turn-helix domain-containing protein [Candidatus Woesearchaeota archaeon]